MFYNIEELTSDILQGMKTVDKLEKDLVHNTIEISMDNEDGGKLIIRDTSL